MMDVQSFTKPIIERAMYFKFKRTYRMRDAFNRVTLAVGIVVHRIDAPAIAGSVMVCMKDPVHDGIAHVHIGGAHSDFCPKNTAAVGKLASAHSAK